MNIPDFTTLKGPQWTEKYFIFHYPEFRDFLNKNYPEDISFQEKLYWYINNIDTYPLCPTCGKRLKLINTRTGYQKYCTKKCSNSNPDKKELANKIMQERWGGFGNASKAIKERVTQTNLKRYGVECVFQDKNKQEQIKQTIIERYGGQGNASEILKKKQQKTLMERYGVNNIMQRQEIKDLHVKHSLERCGYVNHLITPEAIQKTKEIRLKKTFQDHKEIIDISEDRGTWICSCPHPDCKLCEDKYYVVSRSIFLDRYRDRTEPCTRILPVHKNNNRNTSLEIFVKRILDNYNIVYIENDRSILNGKELDIYIPDKKLAIECNGVYSHCDEYKDKLYHIRKWRECSEKGIQLISIWEDWIKNKPEIVESLILSKLGIYKERFGARNFIVKEITDSKLVNTFLEANHIQGKTSYSYAIGLFLNNELYSVMTFGKQKGCSGSNKEKMNEFSLSRFCNRKNTQIVGAASRLLKFFICKYNPESIISFAQNDISNGNLYNKLGFQREDKINNSYWYISLGSLHRYHRSTFTKNAIVRRGWKNTNDNTWTEKEVMKEHKFIRIYDSGITKFTLSIQ